MMRILITPSLVSTVPRGRSRGAGLGLPALAALVLTACADDAVALPTRDEVVAAHVAEGFDETVAVCIVGIGGKEFTLDRILPDATRTAEEAQAYEDLVDSCEKAGAFVLETDTQPVPVDVDGPHAFGDDPELDRLWTDCGAGNGVACDQLWLQSPVGSEYERFGVTCGDRPDVLDCAEELHDVAAEAGSTAASDGPADPPADAAPN